jgi:DNA uptake protein ComE-like DNA-binding protein
LFNLISTVFSRRRVVINSDESEGDNDECSVIAVKKVQIKSKSEAKKTVNSKKQTTSNGKSKKAASKSTKKKTAQTKSSRKKKASRYEESDEDQENDEGGEDDERNEDDFDEDVDEEVLNDMSDDDDDYSRATGQPAGGTSNRVVNHQQLKDETLKLFNEASFEDIQSLIGCSAATVEAIIARRPFHTFDDLVIQYFLLVSYIQNIFIKLENFNNKKKKVRRSMHFNYCVDPAKEAIHARSVVNNLLERCQSISVRLENRMASFMENSSSKNGGGASRSDDGVMTKADLSKLEISAQPKSLSKK